MNSNDPQYLGISTAMLVLCIAGFAGTIYALIRLIDAYISVKPSGLRKLGYIGLFILSGAAISNPLVIESVSPSVAFVTQNGVVLDIPRRIPAMWQEEFNALERNNYVVDTSHNLYKTAWVNALFVEDGKRAHHIRVGLTFAVGKSPQERYQFEKSFGRGVGMGLLGGRTAGVKPPFRETLLEAMELKVAAELNRVIEAHQQELAPLYDPEHGGQVEKLKTIVSNAMSEFNRSRGLQVKNCTFVVL